MVAPNPKKILLVDDDNDIRELLRFDIQKAMPHVILEEAQDGIHATQLLETKSYDCVVTDIQMPGQDGRSLVRFMKSSTGNATTPVIVLTGFPDDSLYDQFDYLVVVEKPFERRHLLKAIETQILLGPTNHRIPTMLLNPFVEAASELFLSLTGNPARRQRPQVRYPNQEIPGDTLHALYLEVGPVRCRFAIGFDHSLLDYLRDKLFESITQHNFIAIAKEIATQFVEKANAVIVRYEGKPMEILGSVSTSSKTDSSYQDLADGKGFTIPVETDFGVIYLIALSGIAPFEA